MNRVLAVMLLGMLVGCAPERDDSSAQTERAGATAAAPGADSTHAGHTAPAADSAHAGHGALASESAPPAGSMAGMDHSAMQQSRPAATAAPMGGHDTHAAASGNNAPRVDHSGMNMPVAGARNAADHANMPGMAQQPSRTTGDVMDHAAHTVASGDASTTEKLMALARVLVADSAVMRTIVANDSLRAAWNNPAVRQALGRH